MSELVAVLDADRIILAQNALNLGIKAAPAGIEKPTTTFYNLEHRQEKSFFLRNFLLQIPGSVHFTTATFYDIKGDRRLTS